MNQTDKPKRITLIAIAATFYLGSAVIFFWFKPTTAKPSEEIKATPVLFGTNELEIGMNLYAASNNFHFGTIVELDRFHEFPGGSTQPGVLMGQTNGLKVWIPAEKMSEMMVVQ